MVTVIIPAYNEEKYICKCIESIQNQTAAEFIAEIVIINDGSQDNTKDLVLSLSQRHEKVRLISTKNQGVAAARNLGVENASTDLVAFCDANDYWEKDKLSSQLKFYYTFPNRLIYAQCIKYDGARKIVQGLMPPFLSTFFIICGAIIISPSTWLINKKKLQKKLFQSKFGEDTLACLESAKSNLFIQQNVAHTVVRIQDVGLSADASFAVRNRLKSLRQLTLNRPMRWLLSGYEPFYTLIIGLKRGKPQFQKISINQALTIPVYAFATLVTRIWRMIGT